VATGDSIQAAVELLQSVPETVRRLERKLSATEKARDARAAKIVQLQQEVQRYVSLAFQSNYQLTFGSLRDRNRSLEEAMEALKARR
jgi:adenylate kinase